MSKFLPWYVTDIVSKMLLKLSKLFKALSDDELDLVSVLSTGLLTVLSVKREIRSLLFVKLLNDNQS